MGGVLRVTERKEVQQIRHGVHLKVSTLLNTLAGDFFFFFSFNGEGKGTLKMYAKHITTILTAEGKKNQLLCNDYECNYCYAERQKWPNLS